MKKILTMISNTVFVVLAINILDITTEVIATTRNSNQETREQNNIDLENATELANLIYKNEKERLLFLKQYLKGYEETKEYKLARI